MNYDVLTVRTPDENDDSLYPVMGDGPGGIAPESLDGEVLELSASALSLRQFKDDAFEELAFLKDVDMDLMVTDSRVIVACEQWAKGDQYWGVGLGATLALVETKLSQAKANREARGTMLLGQVRYGWIKNVGYEPRSGWRSPGKLRIGTSEMTDSGEVRNLYLDLVLPKEVDPATAAQSIAQRTARYWLNNMDVQDQEVRANFEELANAQPLPSPGSKKFAVYQMPVYQYASSATAEPSEVPTSTPS